MMSKCEFLKRGWNKPRFSKACSGSRVLFYDLFLMATLPFPIRRKTFAWAARLVLYCTLFPAVLWIRILESGYGSGSSISS